MAQLNDLIVTGPSRCIGPATFSEIIKLGGAVLTYDAETNTIKITFEEEE